VPGFCWWPVMPVVRLSRMMVITLLRFIGHIDQRRQAGVEKVESPMTATIRSPNARLGRAMGHADGGPHAAAGVDRR